jgi:hypothetical protein
MWLAFGKSAFYRHFFDGISMCPVYNEDDIDAVISGINESLVNINENIHFLDDVNHIYYFLYRINLTSYSN